MTSTGNPAIPAGTAVCRRPGCGEPLPPHDRGRTRVYCSASCARRYNNDLRVPAAATAGPDDQDPLTALTGRLCQALALARAAAGQAAALDPPRVRAQLAEAEAARRRAEAAAVTAQAQASEALEQARAMAEALDAERAAGTAAETAAQTAHDQAAHDRDQAQAQITALREQHAAELAAAREHAARCERERDQALAAARAAAIETGRTRQAETDARAETSRVRADAARERDALAAALAAARDAERTTADAWRTRAENAEQALGTERAERHKLTAHITSLTRPEPGVSDSPPPPQANSHRTGKTSAQRGNYPTT